MTYLYGASGHSAEIENALFELPVNRTERELPVWQWRRDQLRVVHRILVELSVQIELGGYFMDAPERSPIARTNVAGECFYCTCYRSTGKLPGEI